MRDIFNPGTPGFYYIAGLRRQAGYTVRKIGRKIFPWPDSREI